MTFPPVFHDVSLHFTLLGQALAQAARANRSMVRANIAEIDRS